MVCAPYLQILFYTEPFVEIFRVKLEKSPGEVP